MSKIGLIISREFNTRVRKRSFILITLLMPIGLLLLAVVPGLVVMYGGGGGKVQDIVVVDGSSGLVGAGLVDFDDVRFRVVQGTYPEVMHSEPDAYGYLEIGADVVQNPSNVRLYSQHNTTMGLQSGINRQISDIITQRRVADTGIEGLGGIMERVVAKSRLSTFRVSAGSESGEARATSSIVAVGAGYLSGFVIYMFILIYGMMVLHGVVEERQNRIIELMISSVRPFELMMGKVLGIGLVAILQFMIWGVLMAVLSLVVLPIITAGVASIGDASSALPRELSTELMGVINVLSDPLFVLRVLGAFLVFFVGGYLLYGAMYAAVGSAVDSANEAQSLQIPVTIPIIAAMLIMTSAMQDPNTPLAFWASLVPFTSPIIMMIRVAYGVSWWEFLLSVGLLYGSFVGVTMLAARIYRVGILMYGRRPTLLEWLRWARRR